MPAHALNVMLGNSVRTRCLGDESGAQGVPGEVAFDACLADDTLDEAGNVFRVDPVSREVVLPAVERPEERPFLLK